MLGRLLLAALLTLAAGCTPMYQPRGPAVDAPALLDQAIITADGYRLPLVVWQPADTPPRAAILALHGANDHARNTFDLPGRYFAEHGIVTYAYDQRGFGGTVQFGLWASTGTLVGDARTALSLIRARHPDVPLILLGESMGGAVAMVTLSGTQLSGDGSSIVDGAVLIAPAVWARSTMPFYQRWALAVASTVAPAWQLSGGGLGIVPTDNRDLLRAMATDPLVMRSNRVDMVRGIVDLMDHAYRSADHQPGPTLILYGGRDQIIPRGPLDDVVERWPADRRHFTVYPDGYHMLLRDLGAEPVWQDIVVWIDGVARPGGDGAVGAAR